MENACPASKKRKKKSVKSEIDREESPNLKTKDRGHLNSQEVCNQGTDKLKIDKSKGDAKSKCDGAIDGAGSSHRMTQKKKKHKDKKRKSHDRETPEIHTVQNDTMVDVDHKLDKHCEDGREHCNRGEDTVVMATEELKCEKKSHNKKKKNCNGTGHLADDKVSELGIQEENCVNSQEMSEKHKKKKKKHKQKDPKNGSINEEYGKSETENEELKSSDDSRKIENRKRKNESDKSAVSHTNGSHMKSEELQTVDEKVGTKQKKKKKKRKRDRSKNTDVGPESQQPSDMERVKNSDVNKEKEGKPRKRKHTNSDEAEVIAEIDNIAESDLVIDEKTLKKQKKKKKRNHSDEVGDHEEIKVSKQDEADSTTDGGKKKKKKHKTEKNKMKENCSSVEETKNQKSKKRKRDSPDVIQVDCDKHNKRKTTEEIFDESEMAVKKRKRANINQDDLGNVSGSESQVNTEGTDCKRKKKKHKKDKSNEVTEIQENVDNVSKKKTKKDECTEEFVEQKCEKVTKEKHKKKKADNTKECIDVENENVNKKHKKKEKVKHQQSSAENGKEREQGSLESSISNKSEEMTPSKKNKKSKKNRKYKDSDVNPREVNDKNTENTRDSEQTKEHDKTPEKQATEVTKVNMGQWSTADFQSSTDKMKFFRLMGGFKKATASSVPSGGTSSNTALGQNDARDLNQGLENQFERALMMKQSIRKGFGLGYSEPEKPKKFTIDPNVIRSHKFED